MKCILRFFYATFFFNIVGSATFISLIPRVNIRSERLALTCLHEHSRRYLDQLVENLHDIESRKLYIASRIQAANIEEIDLQRTASSLSRLISLKAKLDATEERKHLILKQIGQSDVEEHRLLQKKTSLKINRDDRENFTSIDDKSSQSSPFIAVGGLFAAAALRSTLMNRPLKQLDMEYEIETEIASKAPPKSHWNSDKKTIAKSNYIPELGQDILSLPQIAHNATKVITEFINRILQESSRFGVVSLIENALSKYSMGELRISIFGYEYGSLRKRSFIHSNVPETIPSKFNESDHHYHTNHSKVVESRWNNEDFVMYSEEMIKMDTKAYVENKEMKLKLVEAIHSLSTKTHGVNISNLDINTTSSCCILGIGQCGSNVISALKPDFESTFLFETLDLKAENKMIDQTEIQQRITSFSSEIEQFLRYAKCCVIVCESADMFSRKMIKTIVRQTNNNRILTICVVTSPFSFEGASRVKRAKETIKFLNDFADSVIDIPSDTVLEFIPMHSNLEAAYETVDNVVSIVVTNILRIISEKQFTFSDSEQSDDDRNITQSCVSSNYFQKDYGSLSDDMMILPSGELLHYETVDNAATVKTFGVGDAGCSAIVNLLPNTINTSEIFGVHFDLKKLNQIKDHNPFNTVHLSLEKYIENASLREKVEALLSHSKKDIYELVDDTKLCIVTCEAADIFSSETSIKLLQKAKEKSVLTVCIVSMPFHFEGVRRLNRAKKMVDRLKGVADTVILIQNDSVLDMLPPDASIEKAYCLVDEIIGNGVSGIVNLVSKKGLINANFKDIETIQKDEGIGSMGLGVGSGVNAAKDATLAAIKSPLIGNMALRANRIVISITGGPSMSLNEVNLAVDQLKNHVADPVDIAVSALVDDTLRDEIRVTIFALEDSSDKNFNSDQVAEEITNDEDKKTNLKSDFNEANNQVVQHDQCIEFLQAELTQKVPMKQTISDKIKLLTSNEILSLDSCHDYSASIIYPYLSAEFKAKMVSSKNRDLWISDNVNEYDAKDVVNSLFASKDQYYSCSKLFSKGKNKRQTKMNLLQFSVHQTSLTPARRSGLFGKPQGHKKYLRIAVQKTTNASKSPWNVFFNTFKKSMKSQQNK